MIHEKVNYGKHENVTICEFGTGNIRMSKATRGKIGTLPDTAQTELLLQYQEEARGIGEESNEHTGMNTDEVPRPAVVLVFNNPASITALIHTLIEMQQTMF